MFVESSYENGSINRAGGGPFGEVVCCDVSTLVDFFFPAEDMKLGTSWKLDIDIQNEWHGWIAWITSNDSPSMMTSERPHNEAPLIARDMISGRFCFSGSRGVKGNT